MPITKGFAEINGAAVYFETAGEGRAVIMLHAGIADSRMWDDQFGAFAERFQVIRYDMRGYGQTVPVDAPYSHRQDLGALMDYLGIERAALLGCSIGGETIIDFALEHPDRVTALIPVCSPVSGYESPREEEPPPDWDEIVAAFKAGEYEKVSEYEVRKWVVGDHRTSDQVDARIQDLVHEMNVVALKNAAQGLGSEQSLEPPAVGRLREIGVPTLVIVGALDDLTILDTSDLLVRGIPGAEKSVIANAAHLPSMEHPELFNRLVLDFLGTEQNS